MIIKSVENALARALPAVSVATVAFAFAEGLVQVLGMSLVNRQYSASRILEIGAVLALLAIMITVKQIRDRANETGS